MEYQQFINFLKRRNLYKIYIQNFDEFSSKIHEYDKTIYVRFRNDIHTIQGLFRYDERSMIRSAFRWCNTLEGHEFWQYVNNKWINFISN